MIPIWHITEKEYISAICKAEYSLFQEWFACATGHHVQTADFLFLESQDIADLERAYGISKSLLMMPNTIPTEYGYNRMLTKFDAFIADASGQKHHMFSKVECAGDFLAQLCWPPYPKQPKCVEQNPYNTIFLCPHIRKNVRGQQKYTKEKFGGWVAHEGTHIAQYELELDIDFPLASEGIAELTTDMYIRWHRMDELQFQEFLDKAASKGWGLARQSTSRTPEPDMYGLVTGLGEYVAATLVKYIFKEQPLKNTDKVFIVDKQFNKRVHENVTRRLFKMGLIDV